MTVSPVIILGLVLMWAVVLVPMWLKRHDEVEESRSVDRFTAAMHTLSRYDDNQREAQMSSRNRALDVHVSGASAPDAVAARRRRGAARRRTRSLAVLLVSDLAVFVAAVVSGSVLLWALQIILDVSVVSFVVHLRRMALLAAAARRRAARQAQNRRRLEAALVDEPEWEEGVTIRHSAPAVQSVYVSAATRRAQAADAVFDQTALSDDDLLGSAPAPAAAAAGDGFFDQDADLTTSVDGEPGFIETGARRAVPVEAEQPGAAPAAEPVGGSPWEPVPVPRPTYAMKPPAPQRPVRRRPSEPILPPVERVAEIEADDDLEAILDRRWAVND
ncbi:MAG TPA: hypothetical protein VHE57_13410 [Mycobacteriales bacterium]|nr:hypothetical protein [Mycobacteriales bacterium]